jgi:hypothetical protein
MLCGLGRSARVSGVLRGNCRCDQSSLTSAAACIRARCGSGVVECLLVPYMPLAPFLAADFFVVVKQLFCRLVHKIAEKAV